MDTTGDIKQELYTRLVDYLDKSTVMLEKGSALAAEKVPEIVTGYYQFVMAKLGIHLAFNLTVVTFILGAYIFLIRWGMKEIERLKKADDSPCDVKITMGIIGAGLFLPLCFNVGTIFDHAENFAHVYYSPATYIAKEIKKEF